MNWTKWNKNEEEFLKLNYDKFTYEELGNKLNKTKISVRKKCNRLNLIKKDWGNGRLVWTETEKQFIIDNYGKIKSTEIGRILKRSPNVVRQLYIKLGLKGASKANYKYSYNQNAFSEFTLESCYWAGFLAADGSINTYNDGKNYRLELTLQKSELHHLEKFKEFMKSNSPISMIKKWNPNKTILRDYYRIYLFGLDKLKKDLEKNFNIVQNKTKIIKPLNTENKLFILSFICGYLDGDGSVLFSEHKNSPSISCTSCSKEIIVWIQSYLNSLTEYEYKNKINNVSINKNYYNLYLSGLKTGIIIDIIRKLPIPKLDRKWNNPLILERIEKYKKDYTEYFPIN